MSLAMQGSPFLPVAGLIQSQTALPSYCLELPETMGYLLLCPCVQLLGSGLLLSGQLMLWKESGLWSLTIRARILPPAPPCCVTLRKSLNFRETHQISGNNFCLHPLLLH